MSAFRALSLLLSPRAAWTTGVVTDRDAGWVVRVGVTALAGKDTRRKQLAGETIRASAAAVTRMVIAVCCRSLSLWRGAWP